jgi:3-phenylpropionate/cinnamic acid dioxygenase small subunit
MSIDVAARVSPGLQHEVEQFLYAEAELLDDRRFGEWIELFDDDAVYWSPVRRSVSMADLGLEYTERGQMAFFDDDKSSLQWRVRRLSTNAAWAEDPPSRTRRLIGNVRVRAEEPSDGGSPLRVRSNFVVYRSRLADVISIYSGERTDLLRARPAGGWGIVCRRIVFDHAVAQGNNLAIFF